MKVINNSIEVLAYCDQDGNIRPLRLKLTTEDGSDLTIKFKRITAKEVTKFTGKLMMRITSMVDVGGIEKLCELHYYYDSMKWFLFKI